MKVEFTAQQGELRELLSEDAQIGPSTAAQRLNVLGTALVASWILWNASA